MRVLGWLLALLAVAKADLAHLHQSEFTIVIDAGSTGCRLYVYHAGPDGASRPHAGPLPSIHGAEEERAEL